jgi:putative protein kinase ArgK-like GTPase of G3E family
MKAKMESEDNAKVCRLIAGMRRGDRGSLAEAITLVETEHPRKKLVAKSLLEAILQQESSNIEQPKSLRIGENE